MKLRPTNPDYEYSWAVFIHTEGIYRVAHWCETEEEALEFARQVKDDDEETHVYVMQAVHQTGD